MDGILFLKKLFYPEFCRHVYEAIPPQSRRLRPGQHVRILTLYTRPFFPTTWLASPLAPSCASSTCLRCAGPLDGAEGETHYDRAQDSYRLVRPAQIKCRHPSLASQLQKRGIRGMWGENFDKGRGRGWRPGRMTDRSAGGALTEADRMSTRKKGWQAFSDKDVNWLGAGGCLFTFSL